MVYISVDGRTRLDIKFPSVEAACLYLEELSVPFFNDIYLLDDLYFIRKVARWHEGVPNGVDNLMYGCEEGYYTLWEDITKSDKFTFPRLYPDKTTFMNKFIAFLNAQYKGMPTGARPFTADGLAQSFKAFLNQASHSYDITVYEDGCFGIFNSAFDGVFVLFNLPEGVEGCNYYARNEYVVNRVPESYRQKFSALKNSRKLATALAHLDETLRERDIIRAMEGTLKAGDKQYGDDYGILSIFYSADDAYLEEQIRWGGGL